MRFNFRTLLAPTLLLGALTTTLSASSIDAIYAFGDSLSDAGNIYTLSGGTIPSGPYVDGHFTNGQVWVQDLANKLGVTTPTASLQGGTDFAYGDAQSGTTPVHTGTSIDLTGAGGQISQFHAAVPVADPNALYTIWIGSNDISSILTSTTPANYAKDAAAVVANIDLAINTLSNYGAKNFLILTVPDLGKTPDSIAAGAVAQAAASALSAEFDTALVNGYAPAGLPSLNALANADHLNLSVLDTYSLIDTIVANGSAYGFSDVTTPCVTGSVDYIGGTACSDPNSHLFFDGLHPSAAGHELVADAAYAIAPEPTTVALIGAGLLGLFLKRRKAAVR